MSDINPVGRPCIYTTELGKRLCNELIKPRTLLEISKEDWAPTRSTIYLWLLDNKEFSDMYAIARALQADALVDEILLISDDSRYDWVERNGKDEDTFVVGDHEHMNRSRLRVDSRKWFAAKVLPKRYGEKAEESTSEGNKETKSEIISAITGNVEKVCKDLPEALDDIEEEISD